MMYAWGLRVLESYSEGGTGVITAPFARVIGRGIGASVIRAFCGERGTVWVPATTCVSLPLVWIAMGVLEMVMV